MLRAHRLLSHVKNCTLACNNVLTIPLVISSCSATAPTHTLQHFFFEGGKVRRCLLVGLHERAGLVEDQQSKHASPVVHCNYRVYGYIEFRV